MNFIGLNELNFDVVRLYLNHRELPHLKKLLAESDFLETESENEYKNLEPWIQWYSVYSSKLFREHGVFRLGDREEPESRGAKDSLFAKISSRGYRVGSISMMNLYKEDGAFDFFIPDPWITSGTDGSFWSKIIASAIHQAVNDNASNKVTLKTIVILAASFFRFASLKSYWFLIRLAFRSLRNSWLKVCFFDVFLTEVYLGYRKMFKGTDVGFLFLNGGAHIQHHYMFNSPFFGASLSNPEWYCPSDKDPFFDYLECLEKIISRFVEQEEGLLLVTGLTQVPYDRVKYYYRLKNPSNFVEDLGVEAVQFVQPLMTRDLRLIMSNSGSAEALAEKLTRYTINGKPVFSDISTTGDSLFCTFSYPYLIDKSTVLLTDDGKEIKVFNYVVLCALKNGMHDAKGFVLSYPRTSGLEKYLRREFIPITEVSEILLDRLSALDERA